MAIDFPDSPSVNDTYSVGDSIWKWTGTVWDRIPGPYYDSTIVDAKGDLLVATADNTLQRVAVGSNGYYLTADSAETPGVKWAPSTAIDSTIVDAKGDLIVASADNTPAKLTVGSNDTLLVADSGETTGVKWTSTLTSPTLNTATINNSIVQGLEESWYVTSMAISGTETLDVLTSSAWLCTTNATGNFTLNVRGNSGTTLTSLLNIGDSVTVVFAVTNGATPYYNSAFQIDGSSVTPEWQGGSAPSSGNASSIDVYVYTIIKRSATPTWTVLASQTQFA